MIYTSYFRNLKKINSLAPTIVPISICGKAPEQWTGLQYRKLAPKYGFFKEWKKNHDNEFYAREFNKQVLSKLDPSEVAKELYKLSKNNDIVLVCYEKPDEFCHRHLVGDWLSENGIMCEEINIKDGKK